MRSLTIILTIISTYCYSQQTYEDLLSLRVEEIRRLTYFNNSVIVYTASQGYGSTYPSWQSDADYYQDDMVFDEEGKFYRALVDSKGKKPNRSHKEWKLMAFTHPYFFLRDTAKTEDLKRMLVDTHPYIRIYAFGALSKRGDVEGLYEVLLNNLSDTTRIDQMTSDYGYPVCPADLMISYLMGKMTKDQNSELKMLIETKYQYLEDGKKWLEQK